MRSGINPLVALWVTLVVFILPAAAIDAWHLDYAPTLVTEQLDPILSPNAQSSHLHRVFGGSNFRAGYNFDLYKSAQCSSLGLQVDKSNYWLPQLYWYDEKAAKKFTPMRVQFRFYYRLARNSEAERVAPFPPGLRAVGGNMNQKSWTPQVRTACVRKDLNTDECKGFNCNGRSCPMGFKAEIWFPQCWDGKRLWADDRSHLVYPTNANPNAPGVGLQDGQCPFSHPVRIPQILIESTFMTEEVAPGVPVDKHLIWSFGDTTGFGFHGDFVNGWDMNLLTKALQTSGSCIDLPNGEIPIEKCSVFAPHWNTNAANNCKPAAGVLQEPVPFQEKVPVSALPGCNPVWGTGPKPTCNPPVPGLNVNPLKAPMGPTMAAAADQRAFKWPAGNGWRYLQCFNDGILFEGSQYEFYDNTGLTRDKCTAQCTAKGFSFAAMERLGTYNSWRCTCGSKLSQRAPVFPGMCTQKCPGNNKQTCGGTYAHEVWWNGTPNKKRDGMFRRWMAKMSRKAVRE